MLQLLYRIRHCLSFHFVDNHLIVVSQRSQRPKLFCLKIEISVEKKPSFPFASIPRKPSNFQQLMKTIKNLLRISHVRSINIFLVSNYCNLKLAHLLLLACNYKSTREILLTNKKTIEKCNQQIVITMQCFFCRKLF